jgi:hypothetical protein
MRSRVLVAIALGAALVALAGCAPANTPGTQPAAGQAQTPAVATPAPAASEPLLRPYPAGQGDTEGLSRNPEDCDRGCIGGNPD